MSPARLLYAILTMRELEAGNAKLLASHVGHAVARATWGDGKKEK